ncbi:hypothetical protein [Fischerella sp. PCC 9605]|uniref:hypothetical protein n=1 Tax=Fischerella sp. PCC 9605 TaxID=1173024 RepID=UPI00047B144D|nr:hypothetical protein [Fischerella sp. PCC 9605]
MTQDQSDRLDRIERLLEGLAERQLRTDEQISANTVAINRLTSRTDALTTSTTEAMQLIARLETQTERFENQMERGFSQTRANITQLTQLIAESQARFQQQLLETLNNFLRNQTNGRGREDE